MFWFGLLLCVGCGVEIGGFTAGLVDIGDGSATSIVLVVVFANLAPWTAMAGFALLAAARRKVRGTLETAAFGPLPALRPVLAKIETARATGEGPDIPVDLGLTVAPDDRPGFRAAISVRINLVDLSAHRAGQIVVAAYDPDRPWRVELVPSPDRDWAARAASAAIDSAPLETLVTKPEVLPPPSRRTLRQRVARPGLYAMGVGAALSVWVFWSQFSS